MPKAAVVAAAVLGVIVLCVAVLAVVLMTRSAPPKPTSAPLPTTLMTLATLNVDTLPRGATIRVGGLRVAGTSPLKVEDVKPGDVVVEATLEGFKPATEVAKLEAGGATTVLLKLTPAGTP